MHRRIIFLQNKSFIFYHLTFENDFEFENGYGLIVKILQRNQYFEIVWSIVITSQGLLLAT